MNSNLDQLIETARSGEAEPFDALVRHLRNDAKGDVERITSYLDSPELLVRRAALHIIGPELNPRLQAALKRLVDDSEWEVRYELAELYLKRPDWRASTEIGHLLADTASTTRILAARCAGKRKSHEGELIRMLSGDSSWEVRQVVAEVLEAYSGGAALSALIDALGADSDVDVARSCGQSAEKQLEKLGDVPSDVIVPKLPTIEAALTRLNESGAQRTPRLHRWLSERAACEVDLEKLRTFGVVLTLEAQAGRLPRGFGLDDKCDEVADMLFGEAPRAVVLLGESGTGKTALVNELTHRLAKREGDPVYVLRVSPSELLAGTMYIGEWQTKVRDLIATIKAPKPVVLYVPNLDELSTAGRSSTSTSNIASAIAPHVESGDIAILGESNPDAFREGLAGFQSFRRMFHSVEMRPTDQAQTQTVSRHVRDELSINMTDAVLDRLIELAGFYMVGAAQPGTTVGLLRRVLSTYGDRSRPITERDVLDTLSTSTGVPVDYLDDSVALDRQRIREFFEARVMGQPEAVEVVMERVALVKAGLTDPGKPFGVLFFVGPTGVGKTELARSLAELLFGDGNRMIRLDMSEFATYEAYERLLGWQSRPGLLTGPVRDNPFSVLLLDEIEKAHPNVFDLCLQLFDAGRLTDTTGKTTDFRRTLIILTSNVGSQVRDDRAVGFQEQSNRTTDTTTVNREMGRWFRPEFLNRLDRIVNFRPLDADTVDQIARREVNRVLERSGITRRKLAVDVDPGVMALLLKEGYSPAFGARPLKRTVERHVLLPLAWAVADGNVVPGSLLRLQARNNRVHVTIVPPEADETVEKPKAPAPAAASVSQRVSHLLGQLAGLQEESVPLATRRADLLRKSAEGGFYDDKPLARRILDEVFRLDGVLKSLELLTQDVREQADHAHRNSDSARELTLVERRLPALEHQFEHVRFLVGCGDLRQLGDAFVTLTRVRSQGQGFEGVLRLAKMYMGLARLRGFECEVLDDHQGEPLHEDSITLLITGAGAFALLAGEAGLHQLARPAGKRRDEENRAKSEREVIRVDVLLAPLDDEPFPTEDVRVEAKRLTRVRGRLIATPSLEVQLTHRPTLAAVHVFTTGTRQDALKQLLPLLRARVAAAGVNEVPLPALIRRYNLGSTPKVFDVRSNHSSSRLDDVLKGQLDGFLRPLGRANAAEE